MKVAALFLALIGSAVAFVPTARPLRKAVQMSAESNKAAAVGMAAAAILAGATPAFAGSADAGGLVFSANCAACHAGGNNVIQAEKTLKKDALVSYLSGGFKESSIVTQVTNGKNAMPAFGGRLSDEEIGDVAAYVFATAEADAWE
mmetsp:Transcript_69/g.104  ORF Transcript_69/g.104 Transcript_69/m.104 type:complete len:146 (-) Transcript_69:348-785(-)